MRNRELDRRKRRVKKTILINPTEAEPETGTSETENIETEITSDTTEVEPETEAKV